MKKLKEPKTFNKPRAYIRVDGKNKIYSPYEIRLRIIYPDGRAEWADGIYAPADSAGFINSYPCWHDNYLQGGWGLSSAPLMTAEAAVKAMKKYDKEEGFKTLYIGEF